MSKISTLGNETREREKPVESISKCASCPVLRSGTMGGGEEMNWDLGGKASETTNYNEGQQERCPFLLRDFYPHPQLRNPPKARTCREP